MYTNNISDPSLTVGHDDTRAQKANSRAKIINAILIILAAAVIVSAITIFTLSSKISSVQDDYDSLQKTVSDLSKKFDKNPYLVPLQFYNQWNTDFTMIPQTLDTTTKYTSVIPDDFKKALTWQAQTGGYGTCQFILLFKNCIGCQVSVKGSVSGSLIPIYNFQVQSSTSGYLMNWNFVLAEYQNTLGVSLALIGDASQGEVKFSAQTSVDCSVFGAVYASKSTREENMNIVKVDDL